MSQEKGLRVQKIPISLQGCARKMVFWLEAPFLWGDGKWESFDPETPFSRFPKESFKAIFRNNLTRLKINFEVKNNL